MPEVDLELFSSYELGQVLDVLRAIAKETPDAPGLHALRRADHEGLLYLGRDPWHDDSWVARHEALRSALVAHHGEAVTVDQAAALVAEVLFNKQAVEDAGPF